MKRLDSIDIARPLLMLGVVLIHSSILPDLPAAASDSAAGHLIRFLSSDVCGGCVPAFFIISGFLFFRSQHQFDWPICIDKLRSRIHSLVLPYLIWNLIASGVFLIKTCLLGYDGYCIVVDGHIDFLKYIEGFWVVNGHYPFDFPMWFIRNLIVFVLLAPAIYIVTRQTWSAVIIFISVLLFKPLSCTGIQYFLLGSWLALHPIEISNRWLGLISTLLLSSVLLNLCQQQLNDYLLEICIFARNISIAAAVVFIGRVAVARGFRATVKIQGLTFFVFAIHGLYCTIVRISLYELTGSVLVAYLLTFLFLILSSSLCYFLLHHFAPRLTSLLTGNRS